MNLLEVIAAAMFVLLAANGFRRGFVRKFASMVSLVVSIVLVSALLPHITQFLKERTPVYSYITEQCQKAVISGVRQRFARNTDVFKEAGLDASGMAREHIEELLEENGYDASDLGLLSDEEIRQYGSQYLNGAAGEAARETKSVFDMLALPDSLQTQIIESLPLPEFLRKQMLKYNNSEGYRSLGVSTFQDYIINYLASVILNAVSFILAVVLVQIAVWLVIRLLDKLTRVPGISFLNRVAGGALGLVQGLFVMWLFFLLLSAFEATAQGQAIREMVQESAFLNFMYDTNLFVKIVLRAAAIFS